MGLIKRGITKAALGIAALIGAGAAIGSAAKRKYKESKKSHENKYDDNNTTTGFKRAQHVYPKTYYQKVQPHEYPRDYYPQGATRSENTNASEPIKDTIKVNSSASLINENKNSLNSKIETNKIKSTKYDKKKEKEIQEKINNISNVDFDKHKGSLVISYIWSVTLSVLFYIGINYATLITNRQTVALSIFTVLFVTFLFIFIKAIRYKKSLTCVEEIIGNVKYRLDNYKRENLNNPNSELSTDIIIYQSAYDNLCEAYNKYVSASSNALYRSIFSTTLIDRNENDEKVELKRVS